MATRTTTARDKFFEAINEGFDAFITGMEATEERGHKVSRSLLDETRKGERELAALAKTWVDTPTSFFENFGAVIDLQARAQVRMLELARDTLKGAGDYRTDAQEAIQRMIRANRQAAEALVEAARSATSQAAEQVERLPRPHRMRPEAAVKEGPVQAAPEREVAERRAG
jgi:hypothetical protein